MKLVLFCLALSWQLSANAYVGSVSSATAETGRASIEATDSPFLNPAALPFLKGYYFTSGISAVSNTDNLRAQNLGLSITDNLPDTMLPTSLAYSQSKVDFASAETASRDLRVSVGNYLFPKVALGLGATYRDDQIGEQKFNQLNVNLGTLYAPNPNLGFAMVIENMLGSKDSIPEAMRQKPIVAFGYTHIYRNFLRTRLDFVSYSNYQWDYPTIAAGLESYFNKWVIVRIGAQRRNSEKANAYSTGIGFSGPRFGIHYAYFTSPELESLTRHSVDLAIPIW